MVVLLSARGLPSKTARSRSPVRWQASLAEGDEPGWTFQTAAAQLYLSEKNINFDLTNYVRKDYTVRQNCICFFRNEEVF